MTAFDWHPRTITIEQRGATTWDWEVTEPNPPYRDSVVKSGMCLTRRGALRRARRYRKATVVERPEGKIGTGKTF